MNKRNYQKELDLITDEISKKNIRPALLLHGCCAPCSSYCLEYLNRYFNISILYYNPNISPIEEYQKRVDELKHLLEVMPKENPIRMIEGRYDPDRFYEMVKGYEDCREGSERCFICYEMRLLEAAKYALKEGSDYFCTTLTISPLKNAQKLNEIGEKIGDKTGVRFLPSDFKKKGGYQRSIELSKQYGLYRQNFCGCIFSRR